MQTLELLFSASLMILIWIIQLLHYPSFHFVDEGRYVSFQSHHTSRISLIVIPLMLGEAALTLFRFQWATLVPVVLIWLSTALLQIPCHNRLESGYCQKTVTKLVSTNWIRTILWTFKFAYLSFQYPWK